VSEQGGPGSGSDARGTVRLEVDPERRVGTITIDRPPLNVLDLELWRQLHAAVEAAAADPRVRAVVVRGHGRAFAAGADVAEFTGWDRDRAAEAAVVLHAAVDALAGLTCVTIAELTGYALGGGCEIALACDLRVAADNTKIGLPEILLGIVPGAGGTQRLPRLVGVARAKELILSGRMVDMVEAQRIGLVDAVHPVDEVHVAALDLAARFAAGPAASVLAKRAIDEGMAGSLADGLALERELFATAFTTTDARTGIATFLADGPGVATFEGR
jgi:enoyl-CoA hydratase/carnithine racemase